MKRRVLIVEDGTEYSTTLGRFLSESFEFVRAGDAAEALAALGRGGFDVVFLDMRFDRVPVESLLGDLQAHTARLGGDRQRARRFLEDNQGTFVLAALREAGHQLPVVFSYDFGEEPRRFRNLSQRFGPLQFLDSNAGPVEIREALAGAAEEP